MRLALTRHVIGDSARRGSAAGAKVDFEARRLEENVLEDQIEGSRVAPGEAVAISAYCAGEDDFQSLGAAREILQSERIGALRVGMIDPRQNAPWSAGAPGARTDSTSVDRRDRKIVFALRDQPFEGAALEGGGDELSPLL